MSWVWDAGEYEIVSGPQTRWGGRLIQLFVERGVLRGDEMVVDAGCGTGRVTETLLEHLPEGGVLAVDASEEMVEAARSRFAGDERVRVERQELLELEVEEPVDGLFSTATFHWIEDHDRLFARVSDALKPGGWLVAQCGGRGNIANTLRAAREVMAEEPYRGAFDGWEEHWLFATPEKTRERLEAAGFERVETWMHGEVEQFASVEELARFLRTVVLRLHVVELDEELRGPFVSAVAERLAEEGLMVVDYVRLNMMAVRSKEGT